MGGSGLGRDSGLSTLTLALSLPGRGNKTASPLRARGVVQRSPQGRGKNGAGGGRCIGALRDQSVAFRPIATDGCWAIRFLTDDLGTLDLREPA